MTLSSYLDDVRAKGNAFSSVIAVLAEQSTTIAGKLAGNGLIEEQGKSGEKNVYGEEVEKLDEYANTLITDALAACDQVHAVGSEELAEPQFTGNADGQFIVTHDPLDGSSNIDINLPVGTIFGVYPKNDTLLQKGSTLVAAGYFLYGPSLMLILASSLGVVGFTFDQEAGEFLQSYADIKIGDKKIFSMNEGNWTLYTKQDQDFLTHVKSEGGYSARYVGSMVGDVHRTLLKGGIFVYPADSKHPDGKLRLLYEVAPLSFVLKHAGGAASTRGQDPLDIMPDKHDQRVPIAIGSADLVKRYDSFA